MRPQSQVLGGHDFRGRPYTTQPTRISFDWSPVSAPSHAYTCLRSIKEIHFELCRQEGSFPKLKTNSLYWAEITCPIFLKQLKGRGFLFDWLTPSSTGWSPIIHTCPPQQTREGTSVPSRQLIRGITQTHFAHRPTNHRQLEKQKNTQNCNVGFSSS